MRCLLETARAKLFKTERMALTVASQISQNLLLETKLNHGNIEETSVMLLLQNTTEEARKRN